MYLTPHDVRDTSLACSLCGLTVRPPGPWPAEEEWAAEAELLSDPDEEFEAREEHYRAGKRPGVAAFAMPPGPPASIRRDAAVALAPTRCRLVADGRELRPNWGARFDADHVPVSQPYSIAVHAACAAIAARVASRPRPGVRLASLRTLWKVLRTRFDAHDNELMGSANVLPTSVLAHDDNYYLVRRHRGPAWVRELPSPPFALADPLDVPELTSKLLSNVKPMGPPSDIEKAFQTRFQHLPPELREKVVAFMLGPDGLPIVCTRLLTPSVWRDILLEPKLLPFLWDLDADLVRVFDDEKRSQGLVLDWEQLVRKLSVKLGHQNGGYWALDVPHGLRNRRRIWQLAEEMYVGDQRPWPLFQFNRPPPPTMPKYWDEDGEPLHPVIRVSVYKSSK